MDEWCLALLETRAAAIAARPRGCAVLSHEAFAEARIHDGTAPSPRLLRCAAFAGRGNLSKLQIFVSMLAIDWRDVIVAGEYELRGKTLVHVRDLSTTAGLTMHPGGPPLAAPAGDV